MQRFLLNLLEGEVLQVSDLPQALIFSTERLFDAFVVKSLQMAGGAPPCLTDGSSLGSLVGRASHHWGPRSLLHALSPQFTMQGL